MSDVSTTIVGGIQDISALLPLVGTEQCEEHVGSALDKGFLYVCISPISIFGSLGIVRAAFNIFLATLNIRSLNFIGAKKLYDGGFDLKGSVKGMIALDPTHPNRFLAESRLEAMLEDEYIENLENLAVSWNEENLWWNFKLIVFTVLSAPLGLTPYLYIILKSHNSSGDPFFLSGWGFPIMRLVGSSICAIVAQLLIQMRILVIIKMRLLFLSIDRLAQKSHVNLESEPYNLSWNSHSASETCLWELERWLQAHGDGDDEKNLNLKHIRSHFHTERLRQFPPNFRLTRHSTNVLLHLLVAVGIVLSIFGYVGCFNLIQNASQTSAGPAIWLGLEIVLSVLRIVVWMFNPSWDDSQWGINFKLKPASHPPLVTCYKSQSDIVKNGLELTIRVDNYLEEILAYTGPLERFRWKDVTLQYILVPRDPPSGSIHTPNASLHGILYIIIFYKEQFSWVLFKGLNNSFELRSSSRIDVPGRATIRMHDVARPGAHNLTANTKFMEKLRKHYNHVIHQIRHKRDKDAKVDFHKTWSMQDAGTEGNPQADESSVQGNVALTAEDLAYVRQEQLQRRWTVMLGRLEDWIKCFVTLYREELIQDLTVDAKDVAIGAGLPSEYRSVDIVKQHEANEVEYLLIECQTQMERLLMSASIKWGLLVQMQHERMLTDMLEAMFPDDSAAAKINPTPVSDGAQQSEGGTKYEKLRNRLFDEWQKVLMETTALRTENMRRRLDEQAESTTKRIQGRKYNDTIGDGIISVWKARLGLLEEERRSMASKQQSDESNASKNELIGNDERIQRNEISVSTSQFKTRIEESFRTGLEERYKRRLEDVGHISFDDAARGNVPNDFELMMKRCHKRVDQLFSRMENQWKEFQELDDNDFLVANGREKRVYWSNEALQERQRLMDRSHKHLWISDTSIDNLGGFQNMVRALSRTQDFVVVDFTGVRSPELTVERIVQLLKDVRSITTVVLRNGYPAEVLKAIEANVDFAIQMQQDICLYWHIRVTGQSGTVNTKSKPHILFQERGASACLVVFYVHEYKDHILTLNHLVSTRGRVDIALNGRLLERSSGTWGQFEDFKNEDIRLPWTHLNIREPNHLEIVLTAMTDCEGYYRLSNVFLPARVAQGTITANTPYVGTR